MKQSSESVSLFLDNRTCYSNPMRANSVFRIDWRSVLGSMYDKYDKFKLIINSYHYCTGVNRTTTFTNHMALKMTGLNFIISSAGGSNERTGVIGFPDPTSGFITGVSNGEATLQVIDMGASATYVSYGQQIFTDNDSIIFDKPSPSPTDVSFILRDLRQNNTPPSFLTDQFVFIVGLTIYGLYDD